MAFSVWEALENILEKTTEVSEERKEQVVRIYNSLRLDRLYSEKLQVFLLAIFLTFGSQTFDGCIVAFNKHPSFKWIRKEGSEIDTFVKRANMVHPYKALMILMHALLVQLTPKQLYDFREILTNLLKEIS